MRIRYMVKKMSFVLFILFLVTGCVSVQEEFKHTKQTNTVEAYDLFLQKHQESEYAVEAKQLHEQALFERMKSKNTVEAYNQYLQQYPHGRYVDTAKKNIELLHFDLAKKRNTIDDYRQYTQQYPTGMYIDEADKRIEAIFFEEAKKDNTLEAYTLYIETYPDGTYHDEAHQRIQKLQEEQVIQNALQQNTIAAFTKYLQSYPKGQYIREANAQIEHLQFLPFKEINTISSYQDYIKKFPRGQYVSDAENFIKELEFLKYKGMIKTRYTFEEGKVGEVYIPRITDYYSKHDTIYINGEALDISQTKEYTSGGYTTDSQGYKALFEVRNTSQHSFIATVRISAGKADESYEREEYCAEEGLLGCAKYAYRHVRKVSYAPLTLERTYKLNPQKAVKDYFVVGVERPAALTIEPVQLLLVPQKWLAEKDRAVRTQDIELLEQVSENELSVYWSDEITTAYKQAMKSAYNSFLVGNLRFADDYDPDFESDIYLTYQNTHSLQTIEFTYTLPFASETITLGPGQIYEKTYRVKHYPKSTVTLQASDFKVQGSTVDNLTKGIFRYKHFNDEPGYIKILAQLYSQPEGSSLGYVYYLENQSKTIEAGIQPILSEKVKMAKTGKVWYRIELPGGKSGWISALFFQSTDPSEPQQRTWTEPITGMEFVWVPGRCLSSGECVEFWMGKTEVTEAQFSKWKDHHTNKFRTNYLDRNSSLPIAKGFTYEKAIAFADWLTIQHQGKYKFRLPFASEWEYACLAGSSSSFFWGNNPSDACKFANIADKTRLGKRSDNGFGGIFHCDDGYFAAAPVASFQPNAFGLYDMIGNVAEWTTPENNRIKNMGGSWNGGQKFSKCQYYDSRGGLNAKSAVNDPNYEAGFRLIVEFY